MGADSTVRCVADVHAVLGEGPVWVARENALYWLDINGRKIFRLDENGAVTEWPTPMRIGCLAPRALAGFIAGTEHGIAAVDFAGTMDDREREPSGTLYRFDPELAWTVVDSGYRVTNGPAFSPSGELMYENDSARQITYVFDLHADGSVTNRRDFLKFDEGDGYPDGMTVDSEGCLWIAFWDGWCIRRFSPSGELIETVEMPVARPTSCAFGGPDLDRLYVTSASRDLDEAALAMQPTAGGLFMLVPGVAGLEEVPFAG
jgi:sugar lactone lactonase YvrE